MQIYIHKHTHLENTVTPTLERDLSTALAVSESSSIRYEYVKYCYFHTIVYILQVLETVLDTIWIRNWIFGRWKMIETHNDKDLKLQEFAYNRFNVYAKIKVKILISIFEKLSLVYFYFYAWYWIWIYDSTRKKHIPI